MGKKSRLKIGRRQLPLKPIFPSQKSKPGFGARTAKFLKSKVAVYGLSGAIAIGAGLKFRSSVPYWVGVEKPYKLGMVFNPHTRFYHALPVIEELKWAREHKRPYHVMLVESSGFDRKELIFEVKDMNRKLVALHEKFNEMVSSGFSREDAKSRLRQMLSDNNKHDHKGWEFQNEVYLGLALEGVRMMPAETYEGKILARIHQKDREINEREAILDTKLDANSPLIEIRDAYARANEKFSELAAIRDSYTREHMQALLEKDAKRLFPELAKEKEIRFLAQFGTMHKDSLNPQFFGNRKTEAYGVKGTPILSIAGYAGRISNGLDHPRAAVFDTLGYYLDETLREMQGGNKEKNIPNRPDYARKVYSRAIRVSPEEFEALSQMTIGMNYNQRANYLLNYFIKAK